MFCGLRKIIIAKCKFLRKMKKKDCISDIMYTKEVLGMGVTVAEYYGQRTDVDFIMVPRIQTRLLNFKRELVA